MEEAQTGIARWIGEFNHDRPHHSLKDRTPREALAAFTGVAVSHHTCEIVGCAILGG